MKMAVRLPKIYRVACLIAGWLILLSFAAPSVFAYNASSIDVAFSPHGGATELIVKAVSTARQKILVAAYSFTSRPIASALIDAHNRGVDVEVVVDHEQVEQRNHSIIPLLAAAKIPVRVDIMHAIQHDKYLVIDGQTVETGSFNYTAAAEQHNSENILVLWNAPELAASYAANWKNLWDQAEAYQGQ